MPSRSESRSARGHRCDGREAVALTHDDEQGFGAEGFNHHTEQVRDASIRSRDVHRTVGDGLAQPYGAGITVSDASNGGGGHGDERLELTQLHGPEVREFPPRATPRLIVAADQCARILPLFPLA